MGVGVVTMLIDLDVVITHQKRVRGMAPSCRKAASLGSLTRTVLALSAPVPRGREHGVHPFGQRHQSDCSP